MQGPLETIADRIIKLRKKSNLTQLQLAQKAQVSIRTIKRLEKSSGSPLFHSLQAVALALEIDTSSLINPAEIVQS